MSSQGILKNLARITIKTLEDPKVEMGGVATVLNRAIGLLRDNGHNQFSAEHHPIVFVLIHELNKKAGFPISPYIDENLGHELAHVVSLATQELPPDLCHNCGEDRDHTSQFLFLQKKIHYRAIGPWKCGGWE